MICELFYLEFSSLEVRSLFLVNTFMNFIKFRRFFDPALVRKYC